MVPTRALAALVLLSACTGATPPAHGPAPAAADVEPATLLLTGHGHRVERIGDTLYSLGGFTRRNADPERETRRTSALVLPGGRWETRASTHRKHAFTASAVVDGTLYALGGTVERYDTATDAWTVLPDTDVLPQTHLAAAAVDGRIHVLGGYPAERSAHHVFDPATGTVETAPPPPGFAPTDHLLVVVNLAGRLHCVGGMGGEEFVIGDAHHALVDGTWQPRARPPAPVWAKFAAVAVVDGALFVFEAARGLRYDTEADTWTDVAPLPVGLAMPGSAVIDGRIHVIGGMPLDDGVEPAVYVYDPASDAWSTHR
jgi:hypothetical protein